MKQILQRVSCAAALLVSCGALADVVPYLSFRSQGFNAARELVGWQTQINRYDMDCFYGSFSITPEYTRSFWPCKMARYLFSDALVGSTSLVSTLTPPPSTACCFNDCGGCGKNCDRNNCCDRAMIKIQGTKVENRDPRALQAENFYLPDDFSSEVTFKPRVDNGLVDFNLYLGLDEWCEGMYFRIHMPVVHTRWDLGFCERPVAKGEGNYDPGYFNDTYTPVEYNDADVYGIARDQLLNSFSDFVSEEKTISGVQDVTFQPLAFARMSRCRLTKTSVAELTAALGWNFWMCDDYHFGLNVRAAAPTGNRPKGVYLFEPIVGNGRHWELGGGLTGHWRWWCSEDEMRDFSMYVDGNVTHLFKARQCRTFDLCGKPLSRYMLATKFTSDVTGLVAGGTADDAVPPATAKAPSYQFAKEFVPVANFSTLPVDVSAAVQGELVLKFAYTHCNWQFDLGYNLWGRSREKICPRCDGANGFAENTYGLKGDAFVFGFPATRDQTNLETLIAVGSPAIPLSATESKATIFGGTNKFPDGIGDAAWCQNTGVDNPQVAWGSADGGKILVTHEFGDNVENTDDAAWHPVNASLDPILITQANFDIKGAETSSLSNKVFGHIGYTWKNCECWVPYLGVGAEAEFGQRGGAFGKNGGSGSTSCNPCNTACATGCNDSSRSSSCSKTCSLSQWGLWVKGGVSFD